MITPPFKTRVKAAFAGGVIGAVNPALFVFCPDYMATIQDRFHFHYPAYASVVLSFFFALLFLPCLLSTYLVYPWLYNRLAVLRGQAQRLAWLGYATIGTLFGCMATVATAFFLSLECLAIETMMGGASTSPLVLVLGGTFFFSFVGLFFLPLIVVTGGLFVWANDRLIVFSPRLQP